MCAQPFWGVFEVLILEPVGSSEGCMEGERESEILGS